MTDTTLHYDNTPLIAPAPMTIAEALLYADSVNERGRRRVDQALIALAAEVRKLRKQIDGIAEAADELGEFIQGRAG